METTPEQAAEGIILVRVLAAVLERLVCTNASMSLTDPGQVTKFHALKAPGIGILQYLERIHKYASCSNECFILALIYIDRLIQRNNFLLTELNVHRVVITAILLAAKFFDDAYYNNSYYAKVGGVLVSEMNGLEVDFLFRINFSLHVTPKIFHKYREELMSHSTISQPEVLPSYTAPATAPPHQGRTGTLRIDQGQASGTQEMDTSMGIPILSQIQPTFTNEAPKRHATYITPSPPDTSAKNAALHLSGADVIAEMSESTAGQSSMDVQAQITNPLAVPTFPVVQSRRCSPQTAFAPPAMLPVVPDSTSIANDDCYFVVDNMAYPLHPSIVAPMDVTGVQQQPLVYPSRQATDVAYNAQYFVGGHILTGCSSGN